MHVRWYVRCTAQACMYSVCTQRSTAYLDTVPSRSVSCRTIVVQMHNENASASLQDSAPRSQGLRTSCPTVSSTAHHSSRERCPKPFVTYTLHGGRQTLCYAERSHKRWIEWWRRRQEEQSNERPDLPCLQTQRTASRRETHAKSHPNKHANSLN